MRTVQLTEQQRIEHNKLFKEALALVEDEIPLHDRPPLPKPGWWLRRKLKRAISLFERVLALNPDNWSAMWVFGKVHQRLADFATALAWFERAYQANPSQPDVAREASSCAMDIGRVDAAVFYAHRATQIEPDSAGLLANLALAYLVAGRIDEARRSIERSLALDASDTISWTVSVLIQHIAANGSTPPKTTAELQDYWRRNLAA
jgi:tetratricopeptide (TPR) repeat protein